MKPDPMFDEEDWQQRSAFQQASNGRYREVAYQADTYRAATERHPLESLDDHRHLSDRLFSPLYNSLRMWPYLQHPDLPPA